MDNGEDLKIVLNVRDPKFVSLLEQIKDSTGINYQNTIKFGLLLMFQDEIKKIKVFQAEQAREANQQTERTEVEASEENIQAPTAPGLSPEVKEGFSPLLKVHITFIGQLRDAIETWKFRTGKTYQDIAREGLTKVFSFFNNQEQEMATEMPVEGEEIKLTDFIDKKKTLTGFLND